MIQTDSPFPPLKVEHRYKGVYERAGFDVNTGGMHTETKPVRMGKSQSPMSPVMPSHRAVSDSARETYGQRNVSSRSMPQPRTSPVSDVHNDTKRKYLPSRKSPFSPPSKGNPPYPHLDETIQVTQPYDYSYQSNNSLPNIYVSGEPHTRHEDSNYAANGKNIKNLQIQIEDSNYASFQNDPIESSSSTNSQTFERLLEKPLSPNTSASSNEAISEKNNRKSVESVNTTELYNPSFCLTKRLSRDLDKFKQDVEGHKGYDPRKAVSRRKPSKPVLDDAVQNFDNYGADGLENDDSFQFNMNGASASPKSLGLRSAEPAAGLQFQNLLLTDHNNKNHGDRYSQLSTVSSIISKNNSAHDQDEEIDIELQRQLDGLKNGHYVTAASKESLDGSDSYFTASSSDMPETEAPMIPVIEVHETMRTLSGSETTSHAGLDTESTPRNSDLGAIMSRPMEQVDEFSPQNNQESVLPLDEDDKLDDHFEFENSKSMKDIEEKVELSDKEEIGPLISERNPARIIPPRCPTTPQTNDALFEDSLNTPETIKPLSPKNHKVEEELKNMNFNYDVDSRNSRDAIANFNTSADLYEIGELHEELILLQQQIPKEFEAFPKSVVNMNAPNFRSSNLGRSAPPGTGPCRTCHQVVNETGRGAEKPIYSKSGELSGQWHRGCFSCTYLGCGVTFNKNVACYALLDNAFCQRHYHLLNGTLCQSCGNAIEGECIENELKQKWHVSCLKCSKCHQGISNDYFLIANEIVCEKDAPVVISHLEKGGMLSSEKIEKRRTRLLFLD